MSPLAEGAKLPIKLMGETGRATSLSIFSLVIEGPDFIDLPVCISLGP